MKIQTEVEKLTKTQIITAMGAKYRIRLLIDGREVWSRLCMSPKSANDALLFNLQTGLKVK